MILGAFAAAMLALATSQAGAQAINRHTSAAASPSQSWKLGRAVAAARPGDATLPPFALQLVLRLTGPNRYRMTQMQFKNVAKGVTFAGGCSHCSAPHLLGSFHRVGTQVNLILRPAVSVSPSTVILQALIRPGFIGRFAIYRFATNPFRLQADTRGCLPADTTDAEVNDTTSLNHIATTPCG